MSTAITTHDTDAVARLPYQHADKVKLPALISALANPANAVDAALIQLLTERTVDTAIGAQLDVIGRIVGIARSDISSALSDDDFRVYVKAKISALKSQGTVEDILKVLRQIFATATIELEMFAPAGFVVRIGGEPTTAALAAVAAQFLRDATSAGVRAILESFESAENEVFHMATATFLDGFHGSGATTLTVDDTSEFPASGSLRIYDPASADETVTYTGKTATTFTGVSATAFAHTDETHITIETGLEQGFPLVTFLDGFHGNGSTTLTVDSAIGFPSADSLQIYDPDSLDEVVTYTGTTATTFTGASDTIEDHEDDIPVALLLSGGKFANASEGV